MPESASSSSSSATVKRACDACHRRKVKCIGDGTRPCKNCGSSGLTCTYHAIPQKKGPKGSRAKVISELRETQRQSQLAGQRHGLESPPGSPTFARKNGLLSVELITSCVDYYFAHMYGTMPVLQRQKVGETISQMDTDPEAYCLMVSLCSYMLIQPNIELSEVVYEGLEVKAQSNLQLGRILLAETIRARRTFDYVESPSVWSVVTSFFLFGSHFCLDLHGTAWFHLREATTLALTLNMHEEATYKTADTAEDSRRRRLFWLLFVTERAYALQQHRPLSLYATIGLPTAEDDPAATVEVSGFLHLVNLFRPFDDTFVGLWNKARSGCSTEWLAQLQQQLSDALPAYLQSTEAQAVDLRCSQQWLRTMVWQLSISHGFLSSAAADNAMSFKFPIEISRDLIKTANQFTPQAMEVHGIGLVEKLFDISCTLVDVMSCVPYEQHSFEYGPREYLHQIMTLISSLRGGQQRYMPLLISKIHDTMPNAPGYALTSFPGSSTVSDVYEESQHTMSTPNSNDSTPFGSPPLSAVDQQGSFGAFQQDFGSAASAFANVIVTTDIDYIECADASPMQMFSDPAVFVGMAGITKFDSDG